MHEFLDAIVRREAARAQRQAHARLAETGQTCGLAEREPVTLIQQRGEFELDLRLRQARLMRNCRAGLSVKNGLGGKFDLSAAHAKPKLPRPQCPQARSR